MTERDPPAGPLSGQRLQQVARRVANELPGISRGRPDERIITVKSEPEQARALQRGYGSIVPGRYLNKAHWDRLGEHSTISDRRPAETSHWPGVR